MNRDKLWIAPIVAMAIGVLPMPYGYYTLLKLIVCGCAIYFLLCFLEKKEETYIWIFGLIALLYNPIIPVHLGEKAIWMIINFITAILFFIKRDAIKK